MAIIPTDLLPIKKALRTLYVSGLVILPVVLLSLPADFFDEGQSICISVLLADTECYGCGMTRAIQHLIHLDFRIAYAYNPLSLIVFPLLVGLWVEEVRQNMKRLLASPNKPV